MRLLSVLFFFVFTSHAIDLNYFNDSFEKTLRKDEPMYLVVKESGDEKLLLLRWTLFHNKGLVTLLNYNGQPSQYVLYKRYQESSIKLDIALRQDEKSRYHPYLVITFLGYDYVTKSAKFEILHKDPSGQTSVELKN